jgi:hypothetical protein
MQHTIRIPNSKHLQRSTSCCMPLVLLLLPGLC